MATKAATRKEVIEKIAKEVLKLETLETRNSDSLDFSDQAVWTLRAALEAAYAEGVATDSARYVPLSVVDFRLSTPMQENGPPSNGNRGLPFGR